MHPRYDWCEGQKDGEKWGVEEAGVWVGGDMIDSDTYVNIAYHNMRWIYYIYFDRMICHRDVWAIIRHDTENVRHRGLQEVIINNTK